MRIQNKPLFERGANKPSYVSPSGTSWKTHHYNKHGADWRGRDGGRLFNSKGEYFSHSDELTQQKVPNRYAGGKNRDRVEAYVAFSYRDGLVIKKKVPYDGYDANGNETGSFIVYKYEIYDDYAESIDPKDVNDITSDDIIVLSSYKVLTYEGKTRDLNNYFWKTRCEDRDTSNLVVDINDFTRYLPQNYNECYLYNALSRAYDESSNLNGYLLSLRTLGQINSRKPVEADVKIDQQDAGKNKKIT